MFLKHLLLIAIAFSFSQSYASQWTQRSDFSGSSRHRATAASVGNKGYLGLGHFNGTGVETYFADWWEFDPASNSWTQKADFIGNNGNGELGARAISLETVCFIGLGELDHTSLFKYDPATNLWIEVATPPASNQFRDTQDMVIGHKAYFTDLWGDELYEYDCDLDTWTLKGPTPFPWYFVFSGFSAEGKGYIKAYDELWQYDPLLNSWSMINNFPGIAQLASVCFMQHGKAYIVCGHGTSGSEVTSEVWQYDPTTTIWTQFENFPGSSRRYSAGMAIGDKCYLGTGTNGTNFNDFWEFNSIAGIDEFDISTFSAYPNPVSDHVKFRSDQLNTYSVKIYDLLGRVKTEGSTTNSEVIINRGLLASGLYKYEVSIDDIPVHSGSLIFQ